MVSSESIQICWTRIFRISTASCFTEAQNFSCKYLFMRHYVFVDKGITRKRHKYLRGCDSHWETDSLREISAARYLLKYNELESKVQVLSKSVAFTLQKCIWNIHESASSSSGKLNLAFGRRMRDSIVEELPWILKRGMTNEKSSNYFSHDQW